MSGLIDNPILRRMVTVTTVVLALVATSVLLPALIVVALLVDVARYAGSRTPAVAVRLVVFAWAYLLGEVLALLALALIGILGENRSVFLTHRLQAVWAGWVFATVRLVFDIGLEVDGADAPLPPPVVVLSRHASLVDSLLPVILVAREHDIPVRYVLKKELLLDPALDIAGNRLPNHFIDRRSADTEGELDAIRSLASELGSDEAVVIFPEGTRFTGEKRMRVIEKLGERRGVISDLSRSYRHVLPPRPSGTLAILEAAGADVVVIAHRGLEGFARVADVWEGSLVGATLSVGMWRIAHQAIPEGRKERIIWLYEMWAQVDAWIDEHERGYPPDRPGRTGHSRAGHREPVG